MTAEIIELNNHRPARGLSEIWRDFMPLRMTGPEDEEKRQKLIAELQRVPGVHVVEL